MEFKTSENTVVKIELTLPNPDECLVNSYADYDSVDQGGAITLKVFGRKRD